MNVARSAPSAQSLAQMAFRLREFGVVVALLLVIVFFATTATNFITVRNLQNVITNVAITTVVAIGVTMVILTRNIDLSVGSVLGVTSYLTTDLMVKYSLPDFAAPILAVGVGLFCGLLNGVLVAKVRIPAIIVTIATLSIYRGIIINYSGGLTVTAYQLGSSFVPYAQSVFLGLPFLTWVALAVALGGAVALRWTSWGRDLYAIGSNPEAARYAGIPVARRVMAAFAISGALAGLGGFMFAARFAAVTPVAGQGFEFVVISAAVIGGVNLFGGSGSILGVVLGALLIGTIENGFTLLKMSEFWKVAFQGVAIVAAVTLDSFLTQRLQEALRLRRRRQVLAARHGEVTP